MGSQAESDPSYAPKLPLFSIAMQEPEPSGTQTPPLQTTASVPFRWEEEPGKPRPCTALVALSKSSSARCLDPPPRLFSSDVKLSKMPSPTTVLEGPYVARSAFQCSSFRVARDRRHSFGRGGSPERGQLGAMVLGRRGFFGGWGRKNHKGKREASRSLDLEEGSSPATTGDYDSGGGSSEKMTRMSRSGRYLSLSQARSHFWASVYEGLKQVVPWKRSKKLKKDGLLI
ncbi:hypothetical protein VitviT2T_023719 [Vitis vinifera]|uniref:Uncharacterized protein n=2 Tax=Vitis vinifera TaxID=29760 RepID=A5ADW1_VITVI|eukprot:XP_002264990.1 PREDICTED: uncharacterized protein At4g00950 [Vitis vinifera]